MKVMKKKPVIVRSHTVAFDLPKQQVKATMCRSNVPDKLVTSCSIKLI